jgi:hypothetical protein
MSGVFRNIDPPPPHRPASVYPPPPRLRCGGRITGRQPPPLYSVLYGIISRRRCVLPRNFSLEKNQVPRELTLISKSLACLVAQWNSYGGSWKWVTILPILVRLSSWGLPFVSLFLHMCTKNCIHLIVKSLDTQLSSVFYLSWELSWCRVSFRKVDLQFSNCIRIQFV